MTRIILEPQGSQSHRHNGFNDRWDGMPVAEQMADGANLRTVWWIPPAQFKEAHFATFAEDLILPCILAPAGGSVLTPTARLRECKDEYFDETGSRCWPEVYEICR